MPEASSAALSAFVAEAPVHRRAILSFVRDFASRVEPGAAVLDAGAGTAPYRPLFAHCAYTTHDWPGSVHRVAPDVVGDLQLGLPVQDDTFDAILCTEVLEHVADVAAALREVHRIARPGALVAVTVPFVGPLHEEPYDFRRLTNHGLAALLETEGFEVLVVSPLTGWWGTLAQLVRDHAAATRAPGRRPTVLQRVTGRATLVAAGLLGRASDKLDRRLDHRGALPIGWSALAVARER